MSNWTVWVGGGEINSYLLTKDEAEDIAQAWIDKGYDAVAIECMDCYEVLVDYDKEEANA